MDRAQSGIVTVTPGDLAKGEKELCRFDTLTGAFYHHADHFPLTQAMLDMTYYVPRSFTYGELAAHAQALAFSLREMGLQPEQRVPLIVKRSSEMIIGLMAILSCGAQYVPLDGGVVAESTIRHVVEQCDSSVILCTETTRSRVEQLHLDGIIVSITAADKIDSCRSNPATRIDLASGSGGCYVIYTSGTTGKPKGVDVIHQNVCNLVCLAPGNLGIRRGVHVGQVLNISFDMAAWEIFSCLCNGGTLVLRGSKWEEALQKLNVLICTPTIVSRYHLESYPNIKLVATAGEPTTQALADLWASQVEYWNCCGPTETTIVNTMSRHRVGEALSIGRPTPNNSVYILDAALKPVPLGRSGIMWAGGRGVTRGYVGLGEQTLRAYKRDPFANDGSNMYCTGDVCKWMENGEIEILGRADDQVKVKGFRVELDGVSTSASSAVGVERAASLLLGGEIHCFVTPLRQDEAALRQHVAKLQPFYAIPARFHMMNAFPTTSNGKIDKSALRVIAESADETSKELERANAQSQGFATPPTLARHESNLTLVNVNDEKDGDADASATLPKKIMPKLLRTIRHKLFIVYRFLFTLTWAINLVALAAFVFSAQRSTAQLGNAVAANLTAAVLVRQDFIINALFTVACSIPKSAPLWIRRRCAKIYHLGGIHSGAALCALSWLAGSTLMSSVEHVKGWQPSAYSDSFATIVVSWLLVAVMCCMIGFAIPQFRKAHHNQFELIHRLGGWTCLVLFWTRTLLSARDSYSKLLSSPVFWMLCIATASVASSWLRLRRVTVEAMPLSSHAAILSFDYTVPVNGTFVRLSKRPLLEWHSFAAIPNPAPTALTSKPGYSVVVSNAGDWTKDCISNTPTRLWVRGAPTCGVMRIATLFNRILVVATGSGIGPCLGHVLQLTCATQLIWSAKAPQQTFGRQMLSAIRDAVPGAIIHDTKKQGRPDLVLMALQAVAEVDAEAVIIIANETITKKVVYSLETRGVPAYGAIWDS